MTIRMLVDAIHEEETRLVIADDDNILDFDIESSTKRQFKGNIYLAKVTRVEPSLQAAFVEYGSGRQGFLPFSEIHADYYQIPVADKKELLRAQAEEREAAHKEAEAELDRQEANGSETNNDSAELIEGNDSSEISEISEASTNSEIIEVNEEKTMEDLGGDDPIEERPRRSNIRRYKIQEVIKKNQVMLIQVIKEERGNKGASVTTFISLPGRYCVLMPNTSHGGGVSRRINDVKERRKLKELLDGLELSDGMSLIIRTAGMGRSKADIARDYSYLIRLWNKIRELTLTSSAPALVYEEGNVLKRSIRDFFNDDVDELIVAGDRALETAQDFVRMLLPSQIDKVVRHDDILPIFQKYGVERHLSSMNDSVVVMRSGGYIVINSTEALISIDVNSGRATGERNVEDTATRINIEAANEIAKQLRLRDLAGLVVIDFIDMMDSRHRRGVERALKEALRADRAKIQVGRISPFGLLEMSRQRLRPSLTEIQMIECPTCKGIGHIRSNDSAMLHLIRSIENEIAIANYDGFDLAKVCVTTSAEVALNLLNNKRERIAEIEQQHNLKLIIEIGHVNIGQFIIQLEDSSGHKSKPINSEEKDDRLPQSRSDGKGGRNRRDKKSKSDKHDRGGERNGDRNGDRNSDRHNHNNRNDNFAAKQKEAAEPTELNDDEPSENSTSDESSENPQSHNGRRGGRYENRRNKRRGRGDRGGRDNFRQDNNLEGNANLQSEENHSEASVIEGEAIPQYQTIISVSPENIRPVRQPRPPKAEAAPEAQVTEMSEEDSSKPRKSGWWKKIIE